MHEVYITQSHIRNALRIALRTGKYFKLHPTERAILLLASRIVVRVRSQTLRDILLKIFEKISDKLTLKIKAYLIGLEIAHRRVEQALALGYRRALEWLRDLNYILYLGLSYLNTPPLYQAL